MEIDLTSVRRLAKNLLLAIAISALVILGLYEYLNYSTSLAVVQGGTMPGQAALDLESYSAISNPKAEGPTFSALAAAGRVLTIAPKTRCRVVRRLWSISCQGANHLLEVRIIDGSRAGQTVVMCSDSLRILYPWP